VDQQDPLDILDTQVIRAILVQLLLLLDLRDILVILVIAEQKVILEIQDLLVIQDILEQKAILGILAHKVQRVIQDTRDIQVMLQMLLDQQDTRDIQEHNILGKVLGQPQQNIK